MVFFRTILFGCELLLINWQLILGFHTIVHWYGAETHTCEFLSQNIIFSFKFIDNFPLKYIIGVWILHLEFLQLMQIQIWHGLEVLAHHPDIHVLSLATGFSEESFSIWLLLCLDFLQLICELADKRLHIFNFDSV